MYAPCFFAYIALKMARPLSLAQHTLFADLLEQGDVDLFDPDLPENGSILVRRGATNALSAHVYYQGYRPSARKADPGQRFASYLGRADDPAITMRIAKFQSIKAMRAERITAVRALIGAGMPRPDRISGRIIEALARAALFREDAVLLGHAAYQTYAGVLGVRLSAPKCPTPDRATVAIAVRDGDRLGYVLDVLRTIDPSFTAEAGATATYRSANGIGIAVTVAGRGENLSDATGFLIARTVRALVLHGPGIPVAVPAPERYVASAQFGQTLLTAEEIAELTDGLVLAGRDRVLAEAFAEAVAGHPASSR
mgnify:CR=1 FL=1|jgi:hypothetical protein